jgi:AhpD family alkylhydroperoxidase
MLAAEFVVLKQLALPFQFDPRTASGVTQITDKMTISCSVSRRGRQLTRNRYGRKRMKAFLATAALIVLPVVAFAQEAPKFFTDVSPAPSAAAAWQEYMAVMNPKGALDDKTKQLIALGVAAQIPCEYCIYAHNKAARACLQLRRERIGIGRRTFCVSDARGIPESANV